MNGTAHQISHIWIYVKNIQTSIRFYREILGFKVGETFPDGALFHIGTIQLGVHREEGTRKAQPGGIMIILRTNDIEKTYHNFQSKGLIFDDVIKQRPYGKVVPFKDPDGYIWQIVEESNNNYLSSCSIN